MKNCDKIETYKQLFEQAGELSLRNSVMFPVICKISWILIALFLPWTFIFFFRVGKILLEIYKPKADWLTKMW